MTALVEPPSAISTVIALSNAAAVRMRSGARSPPASSTARRAGLLGGRGAAGIDRRDRGAAGQRHAERLDHAGQRRRRTELVAVAVAGDDRRSELVVLLLREPSRPVLRRVLPEVGADADFAAAKEARLPRAAGEHDRRDAGARRSHQLRGDGLVAPREQDDRVQRVGADRLLHVHRHQIAIEHRRSASSGSRSTRSSETRAAARRPPPRHASPPGPGRAGGRCSGRARTTSCRCRSPDGRRSPRRRTRRP